jgi:hypothetical protein
VTADTINSTGHGRTEITMKSRLGTATMAAVAIAALASGTAAEEKLQKLSAGQIRAKIAGMELTDEVHWRELYERGGTVTSDSMGRKRTGKWRVEKDQLCVEFDKEPPAKCYEVWMSGKKVELRGEGLMPLQGVVEPPTGRK